MSSLNSLYIKKEVLSKLLEVTQIKGEKGVEITLSINDESNQYGQNISAWVSQTKEQRESKKNRYFVGNGKCFWTDGKISVAEKKEENQEFQSSLPPVDEANDLPF